MTEKPVQHIVCYSGGHSSALVALEVANRFGKEQLVLINHDMHFSVEHPDIKRFKNAVAQHIGVPITFANRKNASQDQFDVCVESKAFKIRNGQELCTSRLKTEPFMSWLSENADPASSVIYYGFDASEVSRIQRRSGILAAQGWKTGFPLTWPQRVFQSTEDIGIPKPCTYEVFKHGNCIGCLKAGWQHWYIVYCTRPDIWLKAKWAEDEIGHAIHHGGEKPVYLEDIELRFEAMRNAGVPATEQIPHQRFWASAKKVVAIAAAEQTLPCECST